MSDSQELEQLRLKLEIAKIELEKQKLSAQQTSGPRSSARDTPKDRETFADPEWLTDTTKKYPVVPFRPSRLYVEDPAYAALTASKGSTHGAATYQFVRSAYTYSEIALAGNEKVKTDLGKATQHLTALVSKVEQLPQAQQNALQANLAGLTAQLKSATTTLQRSHNTAAATSEDLLLKLADFLYHKAELPAAIASKEARATVVEAIVLDTAGEIPRAEHPSVTAIKAKAQEEATKAKAKSAGQALANAAKQQ